MTLKKTFNGKGRNFRSFFWPIYKGEHKKFLLMFVIFYLIAFNYNLLRGIKDALVITAPASGAETLPFIKVWAILPMALLITFLFTRLVDRFSKEKVIYIMISSFLAFFALFTFFLYPLQEYLHPSNFADRLIEALPLGFKGLIVIFRNWTFTLFYVVSELWGTMVLTVLFWGFANQTTNVQEAKRFYPLFAVGANISGITSGPVAIMLSSTRYFPFIPFTRNSWDQSLIFMNLTVIFVGIVILVLFRYIHKNISTNTPLRLNSSISTPPKTKLSFKKNLQFLARSRYLIYIALIVISYNIALNLIEVLWKNQLKLLYPNPIDYTIYMGKVMMLMGLIATIVALFISGNLLRRFSWSFNALITPLIMLTTSIIFLSAFFFKEHLCSKLEMMLGISPLALCALLGTIHNCMSRAAKYTLFDATKEIAFIPLDDVYKIKGKAAIDGVVSRIGKSGGSILHQTLLIIFSTLSASTPYVSILFFTTSAIWIFAVRSLGKQFNILHGKTEEPIKEEEAKESDFDKELVLSQEASK